MDRTIQNPIDAILTYRAFVSAERDGYFGRINANRDMHPAKQDPTFVSRTMFPLELGVGLVVDIARLPGVTGNQELWRVSQLEDRRSSIKGDDPFAVNPIEAAQKKREIPATTIDATHRFITNLSL